MGYLDTVLGFLKGGEQPPNVTLAPPLKNYPTADDAAYAQKYGFGYDTGTQPYVDNQIARVIGGTMGRMKPPAKKGEPAIKEEIFYPLDTLSFAKHYGTNSATDVSTAAASEQTSRNLPLAKNPDIAKPMEGAMARAALASNRNPLAALGFDPTHLAVDPYKVGEDVAIAGAYLPKTDTMYSNLATATNSPGQAIVHESAHRGMNWLREHYKPELDEIRNRLYLPDEESVVRYLQYKNSGDPEQNLGKLSDKQRQEAINIVEKNPRAASAVNALEELAIRAKKEKHPGGPR